MDRGAWQGLPGHGVTKVRHMTERLSMQALAQDTRINAPKNLSWLLYTNEAEKLRKEFEAVPFPSLPCAEILFKEYKDIS